MSPGMKAALTAGILLLVSALVAGGLLIRTFAWSETADDGCPTTATPLKSSGPACKDTVRQAAATQFDGPDGSVDDPTSSGRISRRMLHTHDEVNRVFRNWRWDTSCWDPHLWNPSSDHPRGRACDFTVGRIGRLPSDKQRLTGWELARWAQLNADRLGIRYIIWDGHIWSSSRFRGGWRKYNGGGVYNPDSPTGGHYDHVHLSTVTN
jgi:hypothetical protein